MKLLAFALRTGFACGVLTIRPAAADVDVVIIINIVVMS